jgi:hypothetical protein
MRQCRPSFCNTRDTGTDEQESASHSRDTCAIAFHLARVRVRVLVLVLYSRRHHDVQCLDFGRSVEIEMPLLRV